jgi:hypothetical protein
MTGCEDDLSFSRFAQIDFLLSCHQDNHLDYSYNAPLSFQLFLFGLGKFILATFHTKLVDMKRPKFDDMTKAISWNTKYDRFRSHDRKMHVMNGNKSW